VEPRSIARARIPIRHIAEPSLINQATCCRFFGLELLDMAHDVAALNLPARVGQLFGVSL
jgi:hypothetical protein